MNIKIALPTVYSYWQYMIIYIHFSFSINIINKQQMNKLNYIINILKF